MYITSDIYRFVDVIKDIVRAFKFITMGVLNICPDALRSPVELWSKVSDDQVKIARCAAAAGGRGAQRRPTRGMSSLYDCQTRNIESR